MKKKMKVFISLLLVTMLCIGLTACGGTTASETESTAAASGAASETQASGDTSEKPFEVGFAHATVNTPFQDKLQLAAREEAKKYNINLDVRVADDDANKQINQIETFISQKKDAILVVPTNSDAIVPAIKKANDAGIPVVAINRTVGEGAELISFIGCDDYQGGRVQGELVKEMLGGKGNIILCQGTLGTSPQVQRQKGLEDYLKENAPDIKIVATQDVGWDNNKTITFVQTALLRFPKGELDGIVNQGPYDSLAALQAVEGAKRDELVGKLIAFDYPKDLQDAISAGKIYGTVGQDPVEEGQLGVKMISLYLSGKKDEVQPVVNISLPKIDKANIIPATWP